MNGSGVIGPAVAFVAVSSLGLLWSLSGDMPKPERDRRVVEFTGALLLAGLSIAAASAYETQGASAP